MTVTLDIPPLLEATVQANAQAKGVSIERYLRALVEREGCPGTAPRIGGLDSARRAGLRGAAAKESGPRDGTRQRGGSAGVLEQPGR